MSRYRLETDAIGFDAIGVTVEVNDEAFTEGLAKEMNDFWSSKEEVLKLAGGDIKKAALLRVGMVMIRLSIEHEGGLYSINRAFAREEGFPQYVFTAVASTALPEFGFDDITVREMPVMEGEG